MPVSFEICQFEIILTKSLLGQRRVQDKKGTEAQQVGGHTKREKPWQATCKLDGQYIVRFSISHGDLLLLIQVQSKAPKRYLYRIDVILCTTLNQSHFTSPYCAVFSNYKYPFPNKASSSSLHLCKPIPLFITRNHAFPAI
jgi:hypothetical protein